MPGYALDAIVDVPEFEHTRDGGTVTIGRTERDVFLSIPPVGLDVLRALAAGQTVGEVQREYRARHGDALDVPEFLDALAAEGFLDTGAAAPGRRRRGSDLPWLSAAAARRLVGGPALTLYGAVIALGVGLLVLDPALYPGPTVLLYPAHFAALTWATIALTLLGVAIHELAHVVAARAAVVPARVTIGTQIYVLVAQTDMSGIRLAPRRDRYVAFAIGAVIDAVSTALLICLRWAAERHRIDLPDWAVQLAGGLMISYTTRLLWQTFLFVRTDGYYILSTALRCPSLLGDTEAYLHNWLVRLRLGRRPVDQSAVPARELAVIRWYAVLWLLGRIAAILVLVFLGLPVLGGYLYQTYLLLTGQPTRMTSLDFATVAAIVLVFDFGGVYVWVFGHLRRLRRLLTSG
ncbi:MAG: hypothetical protein HY241_12325 [Actinobacteria bacterium]|nr:hypothetical protein [Actinomycetota bacterium]